MSLQDTQERRRLLDFYDFATNAEGRKIRLGGGNFATVWKGISKTTREEVAIKIIVKNDGTGAPSAEANPLHAEILKMVDHKNIIQLKDYFDEEKALCLVLELAAGGDIVEKVGSEGVFTEAAAVKYCRQILSALAHCHKRGMVHCDLKCENILFASKDPDSEIKIADFGLAQLVKGGNKLLSGRGTPEYVAPEIIERTGYDTAADMWSVGVLVYTWMSGVFPFYAPDHDENKTPIPFLQQREILFARIRECKYNEAYIEKVSDNAKDFIRRLLQKDPLERWTAEKCLHHPWIVSNTPAVQPLSHKLDLVKRQREVREQEGVSHAFYSILLNSSSANQSTPLLVSATTAPASVRGAA